MTTATEEPEDRARDQARAQLEGIREILAALNVGYDQMEKLQDDYDALRTEIDDAIENFDQLQSEYLEMRDDNAATHEGALDQACDALVDAENALYNWPDRDEFEQLKADAGDSVSKEDAEQRIQEDPLSVQVRSGWYSPGASGEDIAPEEFEILLCTGGPAVRILGELNGHNEPSRAYMQYQDWGTPWTGYYEPGIGDALLEYAQQFYFGE